MLPRLVFSVCAWYFFNVRYNLANKMVLQSLDAVAVGWIQLVSGLVVMAAMWACGLTPVPVLNKHEILTLMPTSVFYAIGQLTTQAALANGNVSFTHFIKSLEPVVNAVVSAIILGQCLHPVTYLTLVPILFGVYLTTTSWHYSSACLVLAMLSNVCFALRNVLAQKHGSIGDFGENPTTKKTNQLGVITILGSACALPFVLIFTRGFSSLLETWSNAISRGIQSKQLATWLAESCLLFSLYQMSSFWVLSLVQPISHSVLNSLKRIVVITAAIIFLQEPVTPLGIVGAILATIGAVVYSLAKNMLANDGGFANQECWQKHQRKWFATAVCASLFCCSTVWSGLTQGRSPLLITMTSPLEKLDSGKFVLVPIPAFAACAGRVMHLMCSKTIVSSDLGTLHWDMNMSNPLCEELLVGQQQLEQANVSLCVQHQGRVGAVCEVKFSAKATEFKKGVNEKDFQEVLDVFPTKVRMISRKTVQMPYLDWMEDINPKVENFTNHTAAWNAAMAVDTNLGNLVWRAGATNLLNPYTTSPIVPPGKLPDALLIPTANLLHIPTQSTDKLPGVVEALTLQFTHMAQQLDVPSVLIGIGMQAELPSNQSLEQAIDSFQLHALSVDMLKTFASRAPPAGFTVRGNITAHLCRKTGIQACVPLGCPSFMINRERNLGAVLSSQWNKAIEKSRTGSIRIAIHLPQVDRKGKFHEEVYKILIGLYAKHDSIFVLQSNYDYKNLQKRLTRAKIKWNSSRIVFFSSVHRWTHRLKQVDFVIGCRIHGTMAGVSAGVASLLLPTDFRTLEMAEAMNLPRISGAELDGLEAKTFNLTGIIETAVSRLDFNAFENTRRNAIRGYSDMLAGMDLEIHPELLQVLSERQL